MFAVRLAQVRVFEEESSHMVPNALVVTSVLAVLGYTLSLFAQGGDALGNTPTTIVAAFIAMALGMASLLGWIVKRQFTLSEQLVTTIDKQSDKMIDLIDKQHERCESEKKSEREVAEKRLQGVVDTIREENRRDRDHIMRERELSANLTDTLRHRLKTQSESP